MNTTAAAFAKVREICLTLPDTKETRPWDSPHFRVGEKIFAGMSDTAAPPVVSFKLSKPRQAEMLKDARFTKAPYVGHAGWVSMDLSKQRDWEEVRALIRESYRAIAPKKSLEKLGGPPATRTSLRKPSTRAKR